MTIPTFKSGEFVFRNYIECDTKTLRKILMYRNMPEIRSWMNDTDEISMETHLAFVNTLHNSDTKFYFSVFYANVYIASIYIILNSEGEWERGIYTIPNHQGCGITAKMETAFLYMLYTTLGIKNIVAEVKQGNTRSIAYHIKMGYTLTSEDKDYKYYILTEKNMLNLFNRGG